MNPQETHLNQSAIAGIQEWFRKSGDTYFIKSPCLFTENKLLKLQEVYEIHDMNVNDLKLIYIKLLWVYLKGNKFHIVGIDITNGDLIMRSQRLNADTLPCNFLICDLLFFDEEVGDKLLKKIFKSDLLEFDF